MNDKQKILDRLVIPEGAAVFNEGDRGDRAYVVQDGIIEILRKDDYGNPIVLGTVEKGGIFGEMALIDDQPRMATARAVVATTVIAVPRNVFSQKLAKCDPFIRGLLGIFVRNIRSMAETH
jgi:CRP-like cAMP-binding protein